MILAEKITLSLVLGGFFVLFLQLYDALLLKPRRRRLKLQKQGIKGPIPSYLYGNIVELKRIQLQKRRIGASVAENQFGGRSAVEHAWTSAVFPHIEQWRREYGPTFMYSTGNIQILCITDAEMVKEISLCTSLNLGKPSYLSTERGPLLGRGILSSNGPYWANQRKIIAPEFYLERVKGFVKLMAESTSTMLKTWESKAESWGGKVEIRVDDDLRSLSADIISRSCFGSNYAEGEKIFSKLQTLQMVMSKGIIGIPGLRYLPSRHNKEIWRLEKEIDLTILGLVERHSEDTCDKDLLQLILSAAKSYGDNGNLPADITPNKFIVDNCKNIYFAGHETTAISASWCLMLLAAHPEWQARARAEVLEICGLRFPAADTLRSLKTLTMVILETLRLYPPVAYVVREALQDVIFKGIHIPKGINIQIPIPVLHQDPDLWDSNVHQFNPERFAGGIAGACKIPQAYMPFGLGTRTCAGQHFAMAELKVILSLILSKFSFSLSPAYQHSPVFRLVIQPEHGVNLHFEKL
ncbi:Cytochrome [Forsythia ovata]|uniref:Cytochrome n=1 Tax=Forsythia ovata TaxID=205694 RepID=A0ABD1VH25_9LAMI